MALRADDNPVLYAAVDLGNRLGLPVVMLHHVPPNYPNAFNRLHHFRHGPERDLARGLRCVVIVGAGDPVTRMPASGHDAENVALLHDHHLFAVEIDLRARPFAEEDPITGLQVHRDAFPSL